ncbi:MAG: ATP-binding cassette domain-containing protein [Magnetococcus sp. WYHC-3]
MLTLKDVGKSLGVRLLFQEVTFLVRPGDRIGLVGPNGAGKTTLLRLLEGVEESDAGSIQRAAGLRIGVLRQELVPSGAPILEETLRGDATLTRLRQHASTLRQALEQPHDALRHEELTHTWGEVDHALADAGHYDAEARAGAILLGLGFGRDDLQRSLDQFSGGWRMRVALAQLLFSRPDLLLLDEPTNHLDLESVAWLEAHLARLPGALILISHSRAFLNATTNRTLAFEGTGLWLHPGPFDDYLLSRDERVAQARRSAVRLEQRTAELESFINRFRAKATKARQVQSRIKTLEKLQAVETPAAPPPESRGPRIRLPEPPPCAYETLIMEGIGQSFGGLSLFRGLHARLNRGDKVGLLGPNGTGKTTLLRLIAGAASPDTGSVRLGDRVKCAYYAQHALEALNPEQSVMQSCAEVAPSGLGDTRLRTLLGGFLFSGEAVDKRISVLSGGERARVALARLFLSGANLLLLDEPTNHLDMAARAALEEALESYPGTVVVVSHDQDLLESVCGSFWILENGGVTPWQEGLAAYLERVVGARQGTGEQSDLSRRNAGAVTDSPSGGGAARPAASGGGVAPGIVEAHRPHEETHRVAGGGHRRPGDGKGGPGHGPGGQYPVRGWASGRAPEHVGTRPSGDFATGGGHGGMGDPVRRCGTAHIRYGKPYRHPGGLR